MKKIKVAFVGNIANNFFREVSALQDVEALQADLYLYQGQQTPNTERPESDIPDYTYPSWIKFLPEFTKPAVVSRFLPAFLSRLFFKDFNTLVHDLNSYDLCVLSGPEMLLIPFIDSKTVFRVTGSDLTVFPVMSYREYHVMRTQDSFSLLQILMRPLTIMLYYLKRSAYQRGIYECTYLQAVAPPYDWALQRLAKVHAKRITFFRLAIDTNVFYKHSDNTMFLKKWGLTENDFVIFLPSRIMIQDSHINQITGQWKASDNAITGVNEFIESLSVKERDKIVFAIPDRTRSDDLDMAKQLIQQLGLDKNTRFIKGVSEEGLTRSELIEFYNCSDVCMDDFGVGWFGAVVVEAAACGCPVITYVRETDMQQKYPWHPLQVARTPEQISRQLNKLYANSSYRSKLSKKSIQWVEEFHSLAAIKEIYSKQLRLLVDES